MNTTYDVEITKLAEEDIRDIYLFICKDNPSRARSFVLELETKILSLGDCPERHPFIPEAFARGRGYRHLIYGKYRVIYRVERKTIYALRVLHSARLLPDIEDDDC